MPKLVYCHLPCLCLDLWSRLFLLSPNLVSLALHSIYTYHIVAPPPCIHADQVILANALPLPVYKKPLALFSKRPVTGFYRDGYCRVGPEDAGNHSVAGVLTDEFLDFTASKGNNLRAAGLTAGCKWCLCASRWKEAMDAADGPEDKKVPKYVIWLSLLRDCI